MLRSFFEFQFYIKKTIIKIRICCVVSDFAWIPAFTGMTEGLNSTILTGGVGVRERESPRS